MLIVIIPQNILLIKEYTTKKSFTKITTTGKKIAVEKKQELTQDIEKLSINLESFEEPSQFNISYVQLDSDNEYELIVTTNVNQNGNPDVNLLVFDFVEGFYNKILECYNIQKYYISKNNFLVTHTKFEGHGTGISDSKIKVYKKIDFSIKEVWSGFEKGIHAKPNSKIESIYGNIRILDNQLIYERIEIKQDPLSDKVDGIQTYTNFKFDKNIFTQIK